MAMFLKKFKDNLDIFDKIIGMSVFCALTWLYNFLPKNIFINISLFAFIIIIICSVLLGYLLRTLFYRITSKRKIKIGDAIMVKDCPQKHYLVESYHWFYWRHIICVDYSDNKHSKYIIHEKHIELFTLKKQKEHFQNKLKKMWS